MDLVVIVVMVVVVVAVMAVNRTVAHLTICVGRDGGNGCGCGHGGEHCCLPP